MAETKEDKKADVGQMFDSIAFRYDFLNHFLSFGVDYLWRRKAIRIIGRSFRNPAILDVATGTCDLAIAAMKIEPVKVTGIDISEKMLAIGQQKIDKKGLGHKILLQKGRSEELPFEDGTYDVAMVAFGVRNFADPLKGLSEMCRVVRNNGMIMVLEFSRPQTFPFRQIYYFYFRRILPYIGRMFSKSNNAYTYLHDTVMKFPDNERFLELLRSAGFTNVKQKRLTGGIASIYTGIKTKHNN